MYTILPWLQCQWPVRQQPHTQPMELGPPEVLMPKWQLVIFQDQMFPVGNFQAHCLAEIARFSNPIDRSEKGQFEIWP